MDEAIRNLPDEAAKDLRPGNDHYRAFVGPPAQYDLMGGVQFALLLALGLRDTHRLLDFGCGSLRAGRLFIPYLNKGQYYGVEPNSWLIDDAIERQLGRSITETKSPNFFHFDDFQVDACGSQFDYIIAQSIFSHCGPDLVSAALASFARCLAPNGLVAATFVPPETTRGREVHRDGWLYPGCWSYSPASVLRLVREAGLFGRRIPWYHPRQTWYVIAKDAALLPAKEDSRHLRGAILNVEDWRASLR